MQLLLLHVTGPTLLRDGVREWRGPHVPDTAVRKIQRAGGRVSIKCLIKVYARPGQLMVVNVVV